MNLEKSVLLWEKILSYKMDKLRCCELKSWMICDVNLKCNSFYKKISVMN